MTGRTIAGRAFGVVGALGSLLFGWWVIANGFEHMFALETAKLHPGDSWDWIALLQVSAGMLWMMAGVVYLPISVLRFSRAAVAQWPKLPRYLGRTVGVCAWLGFLFFGGLIVRNTVGYFHAPDEMEFMEEKYPISEQTPWRWSLYGHVAAGLICMAASILQFFRGVLRRWPALHRWLGRVYAHSVLWVLFPTGMYLAVFAKGGFLGQSGFMLLGVLTFWTTWRGVAEIRAGRARHHARWMIRSFGMITSAITFRIMHIAFSYTSWEYETNYLCSLWFSIVGNALVAEFLARMIPLPATAPATVSKPIATHEPKIDPALLSGAGYP